MALSDNQSWLRPKNLSSGGTTNNPTLSGDVDLGTNNLDNISIIGKIDTALIPDQDNNLDIGTLSERWANLYAVSGVFSTLTTEGGVTFGDNSTDNIVVNGSLDVNAPTTFGESLTLETGSQFICVDFTPTRVLFVGDSNEITENANLTFDPNGNFVVGQNTIEISSGNTTIAGTLSAGESVFSSASVSDLTSGRIVLAGTSGALQDSVNLTFDGSELSVTGTIASTSNISSGGELSGDSLDITNNASVGGELTAGDTTVSNLVVTGNTTLGNDANDTTTIVGDVSQTGDFSITGDLTVSGTLTQNGNAITNQSTLVEFDDTILVLANNSNFNNTSLDVGFMWEKSTSSFNGLVWDYSESHFAFFNTATEPTTGSVNISEYANIKINNLEGAEGTFSGDVSANNLSTSGTTTTDVLSVGGGFGDTGLSVDTDGNLSTDGSINGDSLTTTNGVAVGGVANFNNTTISTSTTTGAVVIDGGVGVAGNLNVGGDISATDGGFSGTLTVNDLTVNGTLSPSSIELSSLTASHVVYGGTNGSLEGKNTFTWTASSNLLFAQNITSTNLTVNTAAYLQSVAVSDITQTHLVISGSEGELEGSSDLVFDGASLDIGGGYGDTADGGVSISTDGNIQTDGTLDVDGQANFNNTTDSSSTSTGAVVVDGGIGVNGNGYFGGNLDATNGDFSGTLTTQNLTVNGTFSPTNVSVGSLNQSYVVYGGASGALVGDASFTFTTLSGLTINNNISTENLAISQGVTEEFSELTNQTGTVTHNCDNGHIFYHDGLNGNITINLTNFSLGIGKATTITLVVAQGATPRIVSAIQDNGSSLGTILWQGGAAPSGTANATDVFCFNIMRRASVYVVLGQMVEDFS